MKKKTTKSKKVVSSKIEITKKTGRSASLMKYHTSVNDMGDEIAKFACSKSDNLLSTKMALMKAVQIVEAKLRANR